MPARRSYCAASASAALLCSSCYAGLGPVIGSANGSPMVGWEVSAATVTAGQTFATASERTLAERSALLKRKRPDDYAFTRRFYLLWEPRIGSLGDIGGPEGFGFAGMGGGVGMRWDRVAGEDRTKFGALGSIFFGGGYALPNPHRGCDTDVRYYGSLAIGVRGSEFYVSPKVGVLALPAICLDGLDLSFN